jgi:quercetin dioxygenase-like cupin family protein
VGRRHTPAVPGAQFLRLDALDSFALADGVHARALFGDGAMLNLVELEPDAVVPTHSHPHEQLGIVLSGEIVMVIDGVDRPCHAMDAMHIPSGLVHGAYAGPEGALVLDVFVPIREDFRARAGGAQ